MILGKVRAPCWLDESSQRIVVPGLNGGRPWRSCILSVRLRRHCRNTGVGVAVGALGLEAARLHSTESGLQKWRQWRRKILTLGEGFTTQVVTLSGAQDFDLGGGFH